MREVICNFVLYRIAATLIVFLALREMESNGSEIFKYQKRCKNMAWNVMCGWLCTLTAVSYDFAVLYIYEYIDMTLAGALLFVRDVVRVPVRGTLYGREG